MKKLLLLLPLILFILSCTKKVNDVDPLFKFQTTGEGKIQFTNEASNATTFEWNFGDGSSSTEENPIHQYVKNGKYTVVLVAKNKRNQVTKIYEVTVSDAPKPVVKFSYKSLGNGTLQFTNESQNADGYTWQFGNGQTSQETSPTHSYTLNGTYEVKLIAKNFNGETESKQNITIADAPKPIADFNFTYGSNGMVSFTNLSKNHNQTAWSFGNGNTSTIESPTIVYASNGNYSVVLTAKNPNGESTITKTVNVTNVYTPTTGQVVFWTSFNGSNIKVYVNGTLYGTITKYMPSGTAPSCDTQGFVTVNLPAGAYSFSAKEDSIFGSTWNGTINVANGACRNMRLTK